MFFQPDQKKWYPARIIELCKEPRSYKVQTPDNVNYRRTEQHIKVYNPNKEQSTTERKNVQSSLLPLPTLQEGRPRRNIKPPTRLDMLKKNTYLLLKMLKNYHFVFLFFVFCVFGMLYYRVYTFISHWRIQGGTAGACPPPTGSISFIFACIFTEKCTHQRLVPPPNGSVPSPMGNPGPATVLVHVN